MSAGENIKARRREKQISVTELAKEIGLTHSTIVRYENGTIRIIPKDQLEKIARVLNCTVEDLTEGDFKYSAKKKVSSKAVSDEEMTLIRKYRQLPPQVQNTIKEICDWPFSVSD